jgi:Rps23 Pro-64 3,4-dihydroxylase Tpa1-like proline 4-hydroxylase
MHGILSSWISKESLQTVGDYRKRFSVAKPFSHVVIPHFLEDSKANELLRALQAEKFTHKESDLFSLNQTQDFVSSKHPSLKGFHALAASKDFSGFMHDLTSLVVKPGALDLAGSLYKPGDYLLCHDDQVEDRKIAYILYLSKGFTDRDGASFMLFNSSKGEPSILAEKHLPLFNHLMVFEVSTISFHAVEENLSAKDRYAVGGWLH